MTAAEIAWKRNTLDVEGSGAALLVCTAWSTPVNPASTAHNAKLRMMFAFSLIPASFAPRRLPPTATVYSPHFVLLSAIWRAMTIPIAQKSMEYVPPPMTDWNVPPPNTEVPGVVIWIEPEITSVSPYSPNRVPSVVTNEEIPITATKMPLMTPTAPHTTSASSNAGTSGSPAVVNL